MWITAAKKGGQEAQGGRGLDWMGVNILDYHMVQGGSGVTGSRDITRKQQGTKRGEGGNSEHGWHLLPTKASRIGRPCANVSV